jgi:hypothetical protein
MRSTGNFHPEWGYFAPSPIFIRTARIVLIAVTVGGIGGASVVLSMLERPAGETSVAARTLPRPGEVVSVPVGSPPAAQEKAQAATPDRPTTTASTDTSRAGASVLSTQSPTSIAAAPEVPAASTSWAKSRSYRAPATTQRKVSRKPSPTSRYSSRGENVIGNREPRRLFNYQPLYGADVPAEYYPRRGYSGYYREPRWGGYYPYGGFDYR